MSENYQIITPPPPGKLPDDSDNNDVKEGKALKGWSLFFFILTCIVTTIVAASIALPFFIIIFGLIAGLLWFLFVAVGTIFTVGLMWTIDGVKSINDGWLAFLNQVFNSSNTVVEAVSKAIPIIAIMGGVIILITWIFIIVGRATDQNRKKYYTAMLIVLSFLSVLYIIIAIITIVANSNNGTPTEFINSFIC